MLKTKEKPLVSVLMTAYNAEKYIAKAVESVLGQTYKNIDFVIVDDASTDNTYKIAKSYTKDKRVRVFKMQKNSGPSHASNFGLTKTKGVLVARMDADDISLPNRLEKQVKYMVNHPDTVLLGGQCDLIDSQDKVVGKKKFPTKHAEIYKSLFALNPVQHPTCMINTALLPKDFIYYHNGSVLAHDLELVFELAQYGKLANLGTKVLLYRQYPTSLSLRNPKETFIQTLQVRLKSLKKYKYTPSLKGVMVNVFQMIVVFALPNKYIYPVYSFVRGMKHFGIKVFIQTKLSKSNFSGTFNYQ